ncbi:MAG: tetratricopeptide repeat protein [Terriglobia bacterium]
MIEFPGGKLQCLSIAWNTRKKEWFHLYPDEKIEYSDPLHWTRRSQNWNMMCAECHTTNLRKNYDSGNDAYQTEWDEINVSCQACHGPGEAHVKWARTRSQQKAPAAGDGYGENGPANFGLQVPFTGKSPLPEIEACARCHSRRHRLTLDEGQGQPYLDHWMAETLREGLYHPDGQILGEVYAYGSFLQSKMYHQGVRCSNCHNPHSLRPWGVENKLCTRCHQTAPPSEFPTLQSKQYDSPAHHFHRENSPGAECVNCHMPAHTYMVVDPRRDHSLRIPRPDLSAKLGTPNACNLCHKDRLPAWAAQAVSRWYGPHLQLKPHYGEILAAGRSEDKAADLKLLQLASDPKQPGIVRATALELLRPIDQNELEAMLKLINDEDPWVRVYALKGLDLVAPEARLTWGAPRLSDPIRAVRVEAARVLSSVPAQQFSPAQRQAFETARLEFIEAQRAQDDMPSAHLNLGVLHANQGEMDQAERAYLTALRLDSTFLPARVNLANLYNQLGRNPEAEQMLRDAIRQSPESGELYYSLGLLLAEENRLPEAEESLAKAAALLPQRALIHYNRGLALMQLGRTEEAKKELLAAYAQEPASPKILNALAVFHLQQQQWNEALPYVKRLAKMFPSESGPSQMLETIRQGLARH